MDIHPLLAALPMRAERDYESLKADIAAHGLLEPVMTYRDLVTDGRGRLQACQELGVEVRTAREWEDEDAVSEEEVAARIISRNMVRAHWTAGQRAAAVLEISVWRYRQEAAARQAAGVRPNLDEGQEQGRAMERAAKQYGVSASSCYMLRSVKNADTRVYEEVKSGKRSINSAYAELERKYLVPRRKPSSHARRKQHKPGDYVNIARAADDRPGYVLGIARGAAAWLATDMLPAPQVVEERILDMDPEDAREAGDGVVAVADYFSAIAQMYQHDVRDPVDAPMVVEITDAPVLAPPPRPRNLVSEWIGQQQAIAGGESMSVDEMAAAVKAEPEGISTVVMALEQVDATLRAVLRGLMTP